MMVVAGLALLLALGVSRGIRTRAEVSARLERVAQSSGIPVVEVIHPKSMTDGNEIALPGNAQAFADTPIYARTSGYVEHWYVDIGAHVREGQMLASIQTPELDQQLKEARAELNSARASLEIAEITAKRWQSLLKVNAVSQQETDQAISALHSSQALVDSKKANVQTPVKP